MHTPTYVWLTSTVLLMLVACLNKVLFAVSPPLYKWRNQHKPGLGLGVWLEIGALATVLCPLSQATLNPSEYLVLSDVFFIRLCRHTVGVLWVVADWSLDCEVKATPQWSLHCSPTSRPPATTRLS